MIFYKAIIGKKTNQKNPSPPNKNTVSKNNLRASLVAQWLGIHLPMQGTRVRSLVREDPTCRGATKPMHHNYRACEPQVLKSKHLEPMLRNKRSHCDEKPVHRKEE